MPRGTIAEALSSSKKRVHLGGHMSWQNSSSMPLEVIRHNRQGMLASCKQIEATLDNLTQAEEGNRENLEKRLLGRRQAVAIADVAATLPYPPISYEPLTWRDADGWPKLVLLALDQDGYVEIGSSGGDWSYNPLSSESREGARYQEIYYSIVVPSYRDVGEKLRALNNSRERFSIKTSLTGFLMPDKTRAKLPKAEKHFGDQLFAIVEVKGWELNKVKLPDPDPLIVGYKAGALFLIDTFDLTPVEKVLAFEYSTPPKKERFRTPPLF